MNPIRKIVFDVDGVIVDIIYPTADIIMTAARHILSNNLDETDKIVISACNWRELSGGDIRVLADFDLSVIMNRDFSPLPPYVGASFNALFGAMPALYANSDPIYDTVMKTVKIGGKKYQAHDYDCHRRVPFGRWARLFAFLSQYADVEIHTHAYNRDTGRARLGWLRETFGTGNPRLAFNVDVGDVKHESKGDVVVEDSLNNLFRADTSVRILHCMSYNSLEHDRNYRAYKEAGSPAMRCYGSFDELCELLIKESVDDRGAWEMWQGGDVR